MEQSRDKYFPQFENQGINLVGGTRKFSPNTIKGLSIPSRSLARMRSDRDRYKKLLKHKKNSARYFWVFWFIDLKYMMENRPGGHRFQ